MSRLTASSRSFFERPWAFEFLACGVTALAYIATLSYGFVYDDNLQILQSPALHDWHYLPQYFTAHVLAALNPNLGGNYYRPLLMLWLRVNYLLFGQDPFGWHAATVLCHVLATFLAFRVTQEIAGDRRTAFAAALLFGLHPSHIENVAWISGVSDPLMACFFLGSFLTFLQSRQSQTKLPAVYSVLLFVCALLTKETAVVFPLLIFLWTLVAPEAATISQQRSHRIWRAIRVSAPYWLIAFAYLGVRFWALHGFSHPPIALSAKQLFLTWPAVLWFYARHLLLPVNLSEFYSLAYLDHASLRHFWLPLALLVSVLALSVLWIRQLSQRRVAWFAVAMLILPLLPVLDLRSLTVGDIVHDRYLYLPSFGFALLIALSLREIEQAVSSFRAVSLTLAGAVIVSVLFATLTLAQQGQWKNDIALYTRGLESAPDNLTVRDNLANALLAANEPERAIVLYRQVLDRNPRFWRSNYNLGFACYKTGDFDAAEDYLQRAIQIDSSDPDQFIYLALTEFQRKKFPQAEASARQAIARNSQTRGYHFIFGLITEAEGDRKEAIAAFRTELAIYPQNSSAQTELKKLVDTASAPGR